MSLGACILGAPGGWHVGRLAAALAARGAHVDVVAWRRIAASLPATEAFGPPELAAADVVAVRGMPAPDSPADRLEQVIFRMDALAALAATGIPVVNPPRALEAAIDKYLCLVRLADAGIPVPRTIVVQDADSAAQAWERLGGDCVAKPLFGSRGQGLVRIASEAAARAAAAGAAVVYLQEFVPHVGWDARLLVVGERVFAMRRDAPPGDWRTNVAIGGLPRPLEPPPAWVDLARRAAASLGATVAGVDLMPDGDGRVVVLEVNGVPGWRGLEGATGADVTGAVADHLLDIARL